MNKSIRDLSYQSKDRNANEVEFREFDHHISFMISCLFVLIMNY